jgi:uncharacterized protein YndB with AHSA1/START domain
MNEAIVVEATYNANTDIVWKAITDRDQMQEWYFDMPSFEPKVGYEFTFNGENEGRTYIHLCKIIEVVPGKKLKHTWTYQNYVGVSYVTFELFPEGNQTRIRLTHEGIESFPDLPDFKRENFQEGWSMIIGQMLKEYVEK